MAIYGPYEYPKYWIGLSTDTKPTEVRPGDEFFETDTRLTYIYSGSAWGQKVTAASGPDVYRTITDPGVSAAVTQAIVDAYSGVLITTTAAGNAQTIASPTITTAGKRFTVINNDTSSHSITVNGIVLAVGDAQMFAWDGTAWIAMESVYATTTSAGVMEIATDAEAVTGTDAVRSIVPASLTARLAAPGIIGGTTPAPNVLKGYTTTATAAGTTTLTASSNHQQFFTGATTQTVVMPVVSTLVLGQSWRVVNKSTGIVTVNSSGGNAVVALVANSECILTCVAITGTDAASWDIEYNGFSSVTGTGAVVRATAPTVSGLVSNTIKMTTGAAVGLVVSDVNGNLVADSTPALGTPSSGNVSACTATGVTLRQNATLPAFSARPTSSQDNILADETAVTVVFGTEIFDQANNFSANWFTAPVTGKYHFDFSLDLTGIDTAAARYYARLVTSNRTYIVNFDPTKLSGDPGPTNISLSAVADMDAGDVAYIAINQAAGGAAQTDITTSSFFGGYLVC